MKNLEISKQLLITCRDIIQHTNNLELFYSQRKLFATIDSDYEEFLKRLALIPSEGFDYSYYKPILLDAFSKGQVESKIWLITEAVKYLDFSDKTVFVLGGWIGVLPMLLFWHTAVKNIRNIELDENCIKFSDWLLKNKLIDNLRYKTLLSDMVDLDYTANKWCYSDYENSKSFIKEESIDIIINTSCDHLADFHQWWNKIPKGMTFILQNNNFSDLDEHINTMNNLTEFINSIGNVKIIHYSGELQLEKYKRFMIIGRK